MRIFFDVDGTLIGRDGSLRPYARTVLQNLKAQGYEIYIWSMLGPRWGVIEEHGLREMISNCFMKPSSVMGLWAMARERATSPLPKPDLCVDDAPAYVEMFGGVVVKPYTTPDEEDRELLIAYDLISQGLHRRAQPLRSFWKSTLLSLAPFTFLRRLLPRKASE